MFFFNEATLLFCETKLISFPATRSITPLLFNKISPLFLIMISEVPQLKLILSPFKTIYEVSEVPPPPITLVSTAESIFTVSCNSLSSFAVPRVIILPADLLYS